ncbi:MAG: hypothetical protein ABSE18_04180 [Minisyncoccia bacterium]|jgi:hypothetical protein
MEHFSSGGEFAAAKRKALQQYEKIGRPWCPALKTYVIFSRDGFEHLIRKHGVQRPKTEQRRRFRLIPCIEKILADSASVVSHEEKIVGHRIKIRGERIAVKSRAHFWIFTNKRGGKVIKVVIRQFEGGEKHFWSTYTKKPSGREAS